MTTMYRIKRRHALRGMRTKHDYINDLTRNFWGSVKSAAIIVTLLLGGLFVLNTEVLSESVVREATLKERLEETWVSCLTHGGMWINNSMHLCRPVDTRLPKENGK